MKNYLLPLVLCLLFNSLTAQAPRTLCGHDHVLQHWAKHYPAARQSVDDVFARAKKRSPSGQLRSADVYKIPVVIHIVWRDSIENLPTTLIEEQMRVLNEDYRRLNPDAGNVRDIFLPVVADSKIEFELQSVIRVKTDALFEPTIFGALPDNVKQSANGGSDAWDTERYLNIWVCDIQPITFGGINIGEFLGYAYPPAGLPNWPDTIPVSAPSPELDGVVVDFKAFGPDNPYPISIPGLSNDLEIKGRTLTHEVGHYLGLRHTWGDGGSIYGGDSCGEDDGVADTPNTASQAGFGCDPSLNTCIDSSNDLPDMIENYMDYAAESCMNSFTQGQVDIMRSVLEDERCGLINACAPTHTQNHFVEATQLQVFPNPTRDQLFLELPDIDLAQSEIQLHTIMGKPVSLRYQNNQPLAVGHLSPGIYLLSVQYKQQQWVERVIIK